MSYNIGEISPSSQETLNQLSTLISSSSQIILCPPGSDCDKTKKTNDLYQKYINEQTLLKNGPSNVNIAEKNYYTFSLGENGYSEFEDKKINSQIDKIVLDKTNEFEGQIDQCKTLNNSMNYVITNINNVKELNDKYKKENLELKDDIINSGSDILTNDRKSFYEKQNYDTLLNWNRLWFYMYCCLLFVFIIMIFISNTNNYSFRFKLGLVLFFCIYNFLFYRFILYSISFVKYINKLLPKNTNTHF